MRKPLAGFAAVAVPSRKAAERAFDHPHAAIFALGPPTDATKLKGKIRPLAGRLKISQSRNSPRPPSETVPVPIPPSGNATCIAPGPENECAVR